MGLTHRNSALIAKRCQYQMSLMGSITSFWGDADDFRSTPAGSTGRRNTGVKSLCWGFKLQGLTWSFV